jgi:hypothetical protein
LGVPEDKLRQKVYQSAPTGQSPLRVPPTTQRQDERQVISMIYHFPQIRSQLKGIGLDAVLEDSRLKKIAMALLAQPLPAQGPLGAQIQGLDSPDEVNLLAEVVIDEPKWAPEACLELINDFVEKRKTRVELDCLDAQLRVAEKGGDDVKRDQILERIQKLTVQHKKKKTGPGHPSPMTF